MRFACSLVVASLFCSAALGQSLTPLEAIESKPGVAELGKRMFYDRRLSGDTSLSCSSCHHPDKAFTDGLALSAAYSGSGHFRNTPTLANVGHRAAWMHDGRLGTNLNDVSREMITETYLMNMDMRIMQERMKQDPVYVKMFADAGFGEPSNGGARNALQAFLNTIVSRNAPIDTANLPTSAQRGQLIFDGAAGCSSCHSGNRFTDDKPYITGVSDNADIWSDPKRHSAFVTFAKFQGLENYMNLRHDPGAYIRNHRDETDGSFLTPSLRELTHSAPYMHNGTLGTLAEVVEFYDQGGGNHPNKDSRLRPLGLIPSEKSDLVAYLEALSGDSFDTDEYVWRADDYGYTLIENWRETAN